MMLSWCMSKSLLNSTLTTLLFFYGLLALTKLYSYSQWCKRDVSSWSTCSDMMRFNILTCLVQALIGSPGIPSHKMSGLLFKLLDLSSCMTGIFHLGTLLSSMIRLCSTFLKSLRVKTTQSFLIRYQGKNGKKWLKKAIMTSIWYIFRLVSINL